MRKLVHIIVLLAVLLPLPGFAKSGYEVKIDGKTVQVYDVKVSPQDSILRMKGMDDKKGSKDIFEMAAFCYKEVAGPCAVKVKAPETVTSARVLPSSRGIVPVIKGREVSFQAVPGDRLTLEINGDEYHSLHIFANPVQEDIPSPDDPNVIYYGPGDHYVSRIVVRSGQTLYLAPGAVLYGEMFQREKGGPYSPVISLIGDNIKVKGSGIVDGSLCDIHTTNLLYVNGNNISIEGIILRDASVWTIPVMRSKNVTIDGVKIFGYRAKSDGIDVCNSENVTIKNCFIRTLDDLIVIKTVRSGGPCENVYARGNILWNEVAHAVSVGAEISHDIRNIVFEDNDIIHDKGREWSMRVYHCDHATVSGIVFRNLRIEESKNFLSLWINKAVWSTSNERGHINGVVFEDIRADHVVNPAIQLLGYDAGHLVEDVTIRNVRVNGKLVTEQDVTSNQFVKNITVKQ